VADTQHRALGSARARLARLAADAALGVDGVLALDAGPRATHISTVDGAVLRGVRAAADGAGRFALDLGVQTRLTPLPALAEEVTRQVRRAAANAELDGVLGAVSVTVHAVLDDDEVAALASTSALSAALPEAQPGEVHR
jgi:hypothetical protein